MTRVPAGSLRPGDQLTCGLIVGAVADCVPEQLPPRYGGVTIRRVLLVLVDSDGTPVAELRMLAIAALSTKKGNSS
jgi:hypothetical protein